MSLLVFISLFSFCLGCIMSSGKGDFGIDVILAHMLISIEGSEVKSSQIEEALERIRLEKERIGIPADQLVIRIRVSPETEEGKLGALEEIVRRMNFTKVEYYDYIP